MTRPVLTPLHIDSIGDLKNRVAMSAMTRSFATADHRCTQEIAAYYERRAQGGAGLILSEGLVIHPSGDGYNAVPHMQTPAQADSWKPAIDLVHRHGTKIYAQLWHCGRISHPDYTDGHAVVSSTDKPAAGINRQNNKPYGIPQALHIEEMRNVFAMYGHSAELALEAGFDGIELHMGHGYLADQFLDGRVNDRTDAYGGSVANRCRFAIELLEAVAGKLGLDKVMVRISPSRWMGGLYEWPDVHEMLDVLIPAFDRAGLRQLDVGCANADYFQTSGKMIPYIRKHWPHLIAGGASLRIDQADQEIASGHLDVVTWGRAMIANPDFVRRVEDGLALRPFDDSMRASLL